MKTIIKDRLELIDDIWTYQIKFNDNPYTMQYKNKDILKCQEIRNIIDNRIISYFKKEVNILKTSDLNLEYIKI